MTGGAIHILAHNGAFAGSEQLVLRAVNVHLRGFNRCAVFGEEIIGQGVAGLVGESGFLRRFKPRMAQAAHIQLLLVI